jgi:hypothetical protein
MCRNASAIGTGVTRQDLMQQAQVQVIDLLEACKKANVNQRQKLARGLFPVFEIGAGDGI